MRHTTLLLTMLTIMELNLATLHSDLSYIGYLSGGKAVTGRASITEMVGKGGPRPGWRQGRGEGGGGGGGEGRGIRGERYVRIMWMGKCSNEVS